MTHSEKCTGKIMNRLSFQLPRSKTKSVRKSAPFIAAKVDARFRLHSALSCQYGLKLATPYMH